MLKNNASWTTKLWSYFIIVMVGCLFLALPAWADNEGDGSGGGQSVPLQLVSSIPSDGQKDVPLQGDIKLAFNKNVIFLDIRDANKNCFSLNDTKGQVPIEVIMADDQLQPEEKRNITIRPTRQLNPGTAYVLKIAPELQGKNGSRLGQEVKVNFVTAGAASNSADSESAEKQPAPAQTADDSVEKDTAANETAHPGEEKAEVTKANQINEENDKVKPEQENKSSVDSDKRDASYLPWIILIIVLAAGAGIYYYKKKK